ncbi:MAG: hypothetical protein ACOX9R_17870 [Armatimonadota bacterium]|jgi:hypothetical protein
MCSQRRETYEEQPAPIRRFIEAPEYLGLADEAYPAIVDVLEEIFEGDYQEAALCWGIGAGKSYAASLAVTYMLHRTLCLKEPQRHFGLGTGSTICFMNMSTNGDQARRVVFGEILSRIQRSPWFKRYKPKMLSRELRFPKDVVVISGNSAETYPLGYNVLGAVIDEAAWLLEADGGRVDAAEEIYNALQRRIRSRFLDRGLLIMISSPRHRGDFLERKLEEATRFDYIYALRRATWEMKPPEAFCGQTFECDGLQIPVEFEPEFTRNPLRAMRDLGARPAEAFEPFFRDATVLERAIDPALQLPADERGRLLEDWRPETRSPRYIHVDLALKKDACGVAMAHLEHARGGPVAVVDLMLRIEPPPDGEIEIARIRELICRLRARGCSVAQVSFDGYQSADSRQILTSMGFSVELVSVDRDMEAYETLKGMLNEGRVRWYRYEPLLRELKGLELLGGTKVDHRRGGSKDVADAVAGAVSEAVRGWRVGEVTGRIV